MQDAVILLLMHHTGAHRDKISCRENDWHFYFGLVYYQLYTLDIVILLCTTRVRRSD